MLISEFAIAVELPVDTIRFYITKGLLKPERSLKGGSNPYQQFSAEDVTTAKMIRLQQTLGYSLAEIRALNDEYRARKAALDTALAFLVGKVDWIKSGKPGDSPRLEDYEA